MNILNAPVDMLQQSGIQGDEGFDMNKRGPISLSIMIKLKQLVNSIVCELILKLLKMGHF